MRKIEMRKESVVVETLEGRRLMTAVLGSSTFDPIVGPVGTTPGTIGGSQGGGALFATGNGFFIGFGGGLLAIGSNFNTNPHFNPHPGTSDGIRDIDNTLFFRKGFPVLFSDGSMMRLNGATLKIRGTNGNDTILFGRATDSDGRNAGLDVIVNGEIKRLSPTFARFIRVISVDAGDGDDVVTPINPERFDIALNLQGGKGNDSLFGGARNDTLLGQAGNDILIGDGGNDLLNGGPGNNTLVGGGGRDTIVSGNGKDQWDEDEADLIQQVLKAGLKKAKK